MLESNAVLKARVMSHPHNNATPWPLSVNTLTKTEDNWSVQNSGARSTHLSGTRTSWVSLTHPRDDVSTSYVDRISIFIHSLVDETV